MRKLASVQVISDIQPIKEANVIKAASVLGWKSVIKEGQFNIGDMCVFVEIDSVFPNKPEFTSFLTKSNRLKTIRLRGQISQGACFPMSILPIGNYNIGDDVTEILGITKYEAPIFANLGTEAKGRFPSFIPKTDEPRVQIAQILLDKYQGKRFYTTEKLDGTSVTYYIKDGVFGACSRKLELKETEDSTIWKIARHHDIENKLRETKINIAIQGELIGEGIQKNVYGLHGHKFYLFNIFDIDNYCYLSFVKNTIKLETVPVMDIVNLPNNVDEIVNLSIGKSKINNSADREGLVFRLFDDEIWDPDFKGRVSFKAINPEYLLKNDE